MKITLATALLLCALVAYVKANHFEDLGDELQNFEDELDELETMDFEDPAEPPKPPINLDNVLEELLTCFMNEGKGKMGKKCIKRFKQHLPPDVPNKKKLVSCVVQSFQTCTKDPEAHGPLNCMLEFKKCLENMGGGEEGSGNWI
ncbi:hypothetical protein ACROYT_G018434 [Oculina patagonica]